MSSTDNLIFGNTATTIEDDGTIIAITEYTDNPYIELKRNNGFIDREQCHLQRNIDLNNGQFNQQSNYQSNNQSGSQINNLDQPVRYVRHNNNKRRRIGTYNSSVSTDNVTYQSEQPIPQLAQKCAWCCSYLTGADEVENYNGQTPQYVGWMCHKKCNL
jgi:hypothetical protein